MRLFVACSLNEKAACDLLSLAATWMGTFLTIGAESPVSRY